MVKEEEFWNEWVFIYSLPIPRLCSGQEGEAFTSSFGCEDLRMGVLSL